MKKLLLSTALALGLASPGYAGNINVTSYGLPDGDAYNIVTTTATGVPDTPYSYYTGPISFTLSTGQTITVYCADLDHYLQSNGTYAMVPLTINGEGDAISETDSDRIGWIATIGSKELKASQAVGLPAVQKVLDLDWSTAAQAAIWDIAYSKEHATSTSGDTTINNDIGILLGDVFTDRGRALALDPYGQGWWASASASQQQVMGFAAPEPSTWAMAVMGFGFVGLMAVKRRRDGRWTAFGT